MYTYRLIIIWSLAFTFLQLLDDVLIVDSVLCCVFDLDLLFRVGFLSLES
jgi:hypothetical protein